MSKCIGCGINLQNEDKNGLGYTPRLDNKYCERCFKTIHYGNSKKINDVNNDLIIAKINALSFFTFYITDFLSLDKSVIDTFNKIENDKILVINKCDLIPNNLILNKLEKNIKEEYQIDDVIFVSVKDKYNINPLIKLIEKEKQVVMCGETSSGKSSLINLIGHTNLTTSKYSNTTMDFIKLKINDFIIYDTPGLYNYEKELYTRIKMTTKVIKEDYELLVGDYILSFKNKTSMCLYIKDTIKVKTRKRSTKLDIKENINENSDIILPNVGFINTKQSGEIIINKDVEVRNSIVGGK